MSTNSTVVLFHGPACADGFGSAWAAWTVFKYNVDYRAINYGDPVPNLADYTTIYVLDFSFKKDILLKLCNKATVVVLDHHKTAQADLSMLQLPGNSFCKFDMTKSGAVLAWEYFHPSMPLPPILEYVQDRDLWAWKMPRSREISAALDNTDRNFESWSAFNADISSEDGFNQQLWVGEAILKYIQEKVASLAYKAVVQNFISWMVPIVNSPNWQSEIGNELCKIHKECPFAVIYFDNLELKQRVYSLRSIGDFDVSQIAKSFGGGGHKNAAGFSTNIYGDFTQIMQ